MRAQSGKYHAHGFGRGQGIGQQIGGTDHVFDIEACVTDRVRPIADQQTICGDREGQITCNSAEVEGIIAAGDSFDHDVAAEVIGEAVEIISAQTIEHIVTGVADENIGIIVARQLIRIGRTGHVLDMRHTQGSSRAAAGQIDRHGAAVVAVIE